MIADMAVAVETSRLLVRRAAEVVDTGRREATALAAAAKLHATDAAVRVALDAIQLLGGYGCFRGRAPERILRDAKVAQIYEGANQIQRLVVGRHVLDPPQAGASADDGGSDASGSTHDGLVPSMDGGNDT
jgi:alkylation response protein AidB-like acyl-CoA dehydrogenase